MAKKGYISEFVGGGRIVSHGQVTDLTNGFKLPNGQLFSLFVRPKESVSDLDTVLSVRCYQDDACSDAPVSYNDWTPMAIAEIAPNEDFLQKNDLYWGSGEYVDQSQG